MPKKQPRRPRRGKRKPSQRVARQRELKPISHPRQIYRERILAQLHDLIVACDELFGEHGESCDCETCCVTSNFVGALRLFRMILEIS
jgi:hypothetical protein